jgi:TRAP-type C4-dicarboxylate transport system substrate-binding protein
MKICSIICGAALLIAAPSVNAQEVTLKVSHFLPAVSNFQKNVLEPWCDKINKDSGGKLKCQIYPSMQLGGTPPQLIDQLTNGVADIIWTVPGYAAGRFPTIDTVGVPFTVPAGGTGGALTIWDFYQKYDQKEFAAYKVLGMWSGGGEIFSTANKPMLKMEDFKNEKLRVATRSSAEVLKEFGGTPVNLPPSQIAESISKGVVDGAMSPWELVPAAKIDEVTKYHTEMPHDKFALKLTTLALLMSKQKYDSLPADLKKVIDENSGTPLVVAAGKAWDLAIAAARDKAKANGHLVKEVSNETYEAMRKATAAVEANWIKSYKVDGMDGAKLVSELRAIAEKHKNK